jgi:type IV secretion system protein TrbG
MEIVKNVKVMILIITLPCLTACVIDKPLENTTWIRPNHVIVKEQPFPVEFESVATTFSLQSHPKVMAAYQQFRHHGVAKTIKGDGFVTYPYDPYSKPIIACAPLNLCTIQLEAGEVVNDISLGDGANWLVSTALVGDSERGSYQINIKPKQFDLATDIAIATNKRNYHLGLVSQHSVEAEVVNFYYPQDSLQEAIQQARQHFKQEQNTIKIDSGTHTNLSQLNFNYQVRGHKPAWRPTRVFDDGQKTFIKMPAITKNFELPVLYLIRNQEKQLVNYRYQEPYYVIDGLFEKAYLIAGKGSKQTRVIINNVTFNSEKS